MSSSEYIQTLKSEFERHRNPDQARPMEAYMKNHFPFFGIKSQPRKELLAPFLRKESLPKTWDETTAVVIALWDLPEREYQYAAMLIAEKTKRTWNEASVELFEQMIIQKSWWDTVDFISSNLLGSYFLKFPDNKIDTIRKFNRSGNLWLERSSLLFQLKYKSAVDKDLLEECILSHRTSSEFFLRKAIGWALRQYSKFNPAWVKGVLEKYDFSGLTIREASKYL